MKSHKRQASRRKPKRSSDKKKRSRSHRKYSGESMKSGKAKPFGLQGPHRKSGR